MRLNEIMRPRTIAATLLLLCAVGVAQTRGAQRDLYRSEEEKTVAILLADNGTAPVPGFLDTRVSQLGDDAAIGVIQYLGQRKTAVSSDSTSPQEIRRILEIIRMAFVLPNSKRVPADGKGIPKATMVLLQYLGCLPAAASVKDDIESTSRFIEELKSRELRETE
jgi:hypothetical protein